MLVLDPGTHKESIPLLDSLDAKILCQELQYRQLSV